MAMTNAASLSAAERRSGLRVVARSPWLCNGAACARDGRLFLSLPRLPGHTDTPWLARVQEDGTPVPFPGNGWNDWTDGRDGRDAFVMANAVHVFADDALWVVDQGAVDGKPVPGAAKIVQLDAARGSVFKVLRFGRDILPARR
jgi:hypothetical protein